jgi:Cullin binding
MQLEGAISLWQQLFVGKRSWPFTQQWCDFLREKHGRPMSADTWRLLLPFKRVRVHLILV